MNKENKEEKVAKPLFSSRKTTYISYPVRYYADNQDTNPFLTKKGPRDFLDRKKIVTQIIRTEYRYHNDLDVYSPSVITEINDPLEDLAESYLLDIILERNTKGYCQSKIVGIRTLCNHSFRIAYDKNFKRKIRLIDDDFSKQEYYFEREGQPNIWIVSFQFKMEKSNLETFKDDLKECGFDVED